MWALTFRKILETGWSVFLPGDPPFLPSSNVVDFFFRFDTVLIQAMAISVDRASVRQSQGEEIDTSIVSKVARW